MKEEDLNAACVAHTMKMQRIWTVIVLDQQKINVECTPETLNNLFLNENVKQEKFKCLDRTLFIISFTKINSFKYGNLL